MLIEHLFARDEVAPSWWANAMGRFLSLAAYGFTLSKQDATHIQVVAGADEAAAIIAVAGRWRWVEATVTRAHPGGGAGTYDIYVTAAENDIVGVPAPYTDVTNYAFALSIQAAGGTPAIVPGTVDIYRKVGTLQWDGAQITRIDQTVPATDLHAHTHATGQPDAIAPADIGAVAVGGDTTLDSLEITGAGTALIVDHDALIDGALVVGGNATLDGTLTVVGTSLLEGAVTAQAGLTLDAGAGTVGQTLTLTGRNAGVANSATLAASTAGGLTYNVPGGQSHAFNVAGGQAASLSSSVLQIPNASQYQIGSDTNLYRIVASNAGVTTLVTDNTGFRVSGLGIRSTADNDIKVRSNYMPASDRLKTTSMSSWSLAIGDGTTDDLHVSYTAATAGAPTYTKYLIVSNAGQLQLPVTGSAGGLLIGADATLYRNAANSLRTGGALTVDGNTTLSGTLGVTGAAALSGGAAVTGALSATTDFTARSGAATAVAIGAVGAGSASGITFQGSEANSSIYRSGAGALTSPAAWTLSGAATALTVTNNVSIGGTLAVTGVTSLTGGATAPTRTPGDNTTNLATTAFVTAAVAAVSVPVSSVFGRTGAVVAGNADYLAVASGGLTGATAAARLVGGTTSGAPTSGTFLKGDVVVDQTGQILVCTTGGTSGAWASSAGSYKGIFWAEGSIPAATNLTTGTRVMVANTGAAAIITSAKPGDTTQPAIFRIASGDFASGASLSLRATVMVGDTAPGTNITVGLYPLSMSGSNFVVGALVSGSSVTFTTPAQSASVTAVTADFALPADGAYCIGVTGPGATATGSLVAVAAQLRATL